ncbi:MAG: HEPN domain-containing protein [Chitinispirillales bacterium]|jgi:HEPN domain-containing protein|nr:HEPN domain-containing protein [Chitinispirillales bacterium]
MDRNGELRQWLSLAEQNLHVARHLADTMHPAPYEVICNQCQQSSEKYLKAYLFNNSKEPPRTHDLSKLLILSQDFSNFTKQCAFLTNFGVIPKYPNELQICEDDMKSAIHFAQNIKDFVITKITTV